MGRPGHAGGLGSAGLASLDTLGARVDLSEEPAGEPSAIEVARETPAARTRLLAHHLGEAGDRFGASRRSSRAQTREQLERVGDQDSAGRGWRVRDEFVVVEGATDRPPRDHAVAG